MNAESTYLPKNLATTGEAFDVQYSCERSRGAPCGGSDRCFRMT
jgi:hypothetical protein